MARNDFDPTTITPDGRPPAKALRRLGIPESAFDTVRFL